MLLLMNITIMEDFIPYYMKKQMNNIILYKEDTITVTC